MAKELSTKNSDFNGLFQEYGLKKRTKMSPDSCYFNRICILRLGGINYWVTTVFLEVQNRYFNVQTLN